MLSERDVEYFLAIVENQNISRAAEYLHITQPALSRFLYRLEKQLGSKLFYRGKTKLSLTDAGSCYLIYAKQYVGLVEEMQEHFMCFKKHWKNTIRIGLPSQIANYIFSEVVLSFFNEHMEITANMKYGTTKELSILLKNGQLDFSMLCAPLKLEDFTNEIIAHDRILLAVPGELTGYHRLEHCFDGDVPIIRLSDIENQHFFVTESFYQSCVQTLLKATGFIPKYITYVPSMQAALELATKGIGIAFVMESMVRHVTITNKSPVFYALESDASTINFYLTYNNIALQRNKSLKLFYDHCLTYFSK